MRELYTLPNTESGVKLALETTLSLRAHGFRTRLVERVFGHGDRAVTVIATPPKRPTRTERGCWKR